MSNRTRKEIAAIQKELKLHAVTFGKEACVDATGVSLYRLNKVLNDTVPNMDDMVKVATWYQERERERLSKIQTSLEKIS